MNPEVKALKQVVETFGSMLERLQYDYIKFKDWFDRVIESDDFLKRASEVKLSKVEKEYTKMKMKEKNPEELKSMLGELNNLLEEDDKFKFDIEDIQ